jgi:hypothetical protein
VHSLDLNTDFDFWNENRHLRSRLKAYSSGCPGEGAGVSRVNEALSKQQKKNKKQKNSEIKVQFPPVSLPPSHLYRWGLLKALLRFQDILIGMHSNRQTDRQTDRQEGNQEGVQVK